VSNHILTPGSPVLGGTARCHIMYRCPPRHVTSHTLYCCSPRHPPHVIPVLATSSTTYYSGARHVIHHIAYPPLPRYTQHTDVLQFVETGALLNAISGVFSAAAAVVVGAYTRPLFGLT